MLRIGFDEEHQRFFEIKIACRNDEFTRKLAEKLRDPETNLETLIAEFPKYRLTIFVLELLIFICSRFEFKYETLEDGWDNVDGNHVTVRMNVPWEETKLSRFVLWLRSLRMVKK